MKWAKYLCHVLTIKNARQMTEFVRWPIFLKRSYKEIKKDCDKKDSDKEDCDD